MKILIKKISKLDLKFTFSLRNNRFIRKNFFDEKAITYKEHQDWFSKKTKNKKNLYFVIFNKTRKVGVIRYDNNIFYYNISISILLICKGLFSFFEDNSISSLVNCPEIIGL